MTLLALDQLVSHCDGHLSWMAVRNTTASQHENMEKHVGLVSKFNKDVPADHTSQAHFHGKVISIGLVIVVYVWQKVFARLNGNWRSTILLFLQTRLFWRVHLSQVYPDLREGREGGTSGEYMLILVPLYITCKSISILIRIILS